MLQQLHPGGPGSRSLDSLFAPRSVAIVGASRDPGKWGGLLARGALKGRHRRAVGLVNRNGGEILGSPSYRSLGALPEALQTIGILTGCAFVAFLVGQLNENLALLFVVAVAAAAYTWPRLQRQHAA